VVAVLAMDSLMVDRIDGIGDVKTMNYASHILDMLCLITSSCLKPCFEVLKTRPS
jgi:hypothetical protein